MAVYCGFCVSFLASSCCMLTETTSALMFQNFEKYVNRSSIFNKVALWVYNFITNEFLFFKVFNHSAELEEYSEPCQTSEMTGLARIFIGFLVVSYFRKTLRLKYSAGLWLRLWNSQVVDNLFTELLSFLSSRLYVYRDFHFIIGEVFEWTLTRIYSMLWGLKHAIKYVDWNQDVRCGQNQNTCSWEEHF